MRTKAQTSAKVIRRAIAVAALAGAVACTPIIRNHGYMPPPEDLSLIAVGLDTRESVVTTLGQPTAGGVFNDAGAYYVASKFRHFGAFAPKEVDREVLAITFDEQGIVSNISRYGLEDGRVVVLSRRVTDSNAGEVSFIRQLFGSLGNVNAADFLGEG